MSSQCDFTEFFKYALFHIEIHHILQIEPEVIDPDMPRLIDIRLLAEQEFFI